MPRLLTLFAAVTVAIASSGLVACGSSDQPAAVTPSVEASPAAGGGAALDTPPTSPITCAQLRVDRVNYEELYRALGCTRERRTLCRGLSRTSPRYDAYRCVTLRKTAAQRRAAAEKKAARAKRAAIDRAQARKAEAKEKADTAKQRAADSRSSRSSSSSSSSSASSSGSSSGSSGGSSGGRRR